MASPGVQDPIELLLASVAARGEERLRLVTFSHAGGGTAQFVQWMASMPDRVSLSATRRPGREVRFREPLLRAIVPMAKEAARALQSLPQKPTVLFGHSIGALVAFETARIMEARSEMPALLIASARPAPHLPLSYPALAKLPDAHLVEESLRRYGAFPGHGAKSRELIELLLPAIRGDLDASEQYRAVAGAQLRCPIWVCHGSEDKTVGAERAEAWAEMTSGPTNVTAFKGGHFYVFDPASGFVAALANKLDQMCSVSSSL